MKEYVLVVRLNSKPLQPEQVTEIREKWTTVVQHWKTQGYYASSNLILEEGFVISGAERRITKGSVAENDVRVISTINLVAHTMEEAIELAQACPTLDFGGTVEVRENG